METRLLTVALDDLDEGSESIFQMPIIDRFACTLVSLHPID